MSSAADPFSRLSIDLEQFQPLNGYVVVEREPQAQYAGKIALVQSDEGERRFEPSFARVVKQGAPLKTTKTDQPIPFETAIGDRVIISKFSGHDFELNGRKLVLLVEADIYLILGREAAIAA